AEMVLLYVGAAGDGDARPEANPGWPFGTRLIEERSSTRAGSRGRRQAARRRFLLSSSLVRGPLFASGPRRPCRSSVREAHPAQSPDNGQFLRPPSPEPFERSSRRRIRRDLAPRGGRQRMTAGSSLPFG